MGKNDKEKSCFQGGVTSHLNVLGNLSYTSQREAGARQYQRPSNKSQNLMQQNRHNKNTIEKAHRVHELLNEHYEAARQDRCKMWVYRNIVVKTYLMSASTFFFVCSEFTKSIATKSSEMKRNRTNRKTIEKSRFFEVYNKITYNKLIYNKIH